MVNRTPLDDRRRVTTTTTTGLKDVYSAPTLRFRVNRKSVGIDFDEYDDVNVSKYVSQST